MTSIYLAQGNRLGVEIENQADARVLRAAFRATMGCDVPEERTGDHTFSMENPSNIVALWATGFDWQHNALMAAFEQAVLLLQKRAAFRSVAPKPEPGNQGALYPSLHPTK